MPARDAYWARSVASLVTPSSRRWKKWIHDRDRLPSDRPCDEFESDVFVKRTAAFQAVHADADVCDSGNERAEADCMVRHGYPPGLVWFHYHIISRYREHALQHEAKAGHYIRYPLMPCSDFPSRSILPNSSAGTGLLK